MKEIIGEIMEQTSIKDFIKNVKIERECKCDDCEYEVTKQAMQFYLNYPHYKEWDIFLHGGTINDLKYGCGNKKGYRGYRGYKGAYLLINDEKNKVLTADILTSIKSIISKLFNINLKKEIGGEDVIKAIKFNKNEIILSKLNNGEDWKITTTLAPYIYAFAQVYYWCGNMMPVRYSFQPGKYAADNWVYKIEILIDFLKGQSKSDSHQKWKSWVTEEWKGNDNIKRFIQDNYLMDCYDTETQSIKFVKNEATGELIKSLKKENLIELHNNNDKLAKKFLLNHVKMIIQRSYRIFFKYQGNWNEEEIHKKNVESIMRYIFEKTGIELEEANSLF